MLICGKWIYLGHRGIFLAHLKVQLDLDLVDMHLGWYANDVEDNGTVITESVWDASIILNDAAFQNHMDWPALGDATEYLEKIPGRLVIDGMNSAAGAMECLGAFVADYAEGQAEEVFESLLSGLSSMGIATKLGYDSLDDNIEWEDLPWTLDRLQFRPSYQIR